MINFFIPDMSKFSDSYIQGIEHFNNERYKNAIDDFKNAIRIHSDDLDVQTYFVKCYKKLGKDAEKKKYKDLFPAL